jgi:hypothetical protein
MLNKFKMLAVTAAVVASSSAAFAATPSQDQTRWFVDSGRYVNGQVPSFSDPAHAQVLIERRNSAVIGDTSSGRDALVNELGN